MGQLYSRHDKTGARSGKSPKAWSKYMRGASGQFAVYACRSGRRAVVLTSPPPRIYSDRPISCYRHLFNNWHRNNEGGLWIAEEGADAGEVRRIQAHPWINDDSDEEAYSEDESDVSVDNSEDKFFPPLIDCPSRSTVAMQQFDYIYWCSSHLGFHLSSCPVMTPSLFQPRCGHTYTHSLNDCSVSVYLSGPSS